MRVPSTAGNYGPYRQTERREIYQHYAQDPGGQGNAYPAFCTPERLEQMRKEQEAQKVDRVRYDGLCRRMDPAEEALVELQPVKNSDPVQDALGRATTVGHDHIRGDIITENQYLDDYVILKSDGLPTYHLAAMVDDHEMEITHVIRGSEWLSTFPLHVNIIRAFGWEEPVWVHLSFFLKPSGKGKMSKRELGGRHEGRPLHFCQTT